MGMGELWLISEFDRGIGCLKALRTATRRLRVESIQPHGLHSFEAE